MWFIWDCSMVLGDVGDWLRMMKDRQRVMKTSVEYTDMCIIQV